MVDPVDLLFGKELGHGRVDALVRREIGAQRLFQPEPYVGRIQANAGKLRADVDEDAGRGGQVAHGHRRTVFTQCSGQSVEMLRFAGIDLLIDDALGERLPGVVRHGCPGIEAHGRPGFALQQGQVARRFQRLRADGEDPPARVQLAALVRIEQGRNQLTAGQIARTAKQHHVLCVSH